MSKKTRKELMDARKLPQIVEEDLHRDEKDLLLRLYQERNARFEKLVYQRRDLRRALKELLETLNTDVIARAQNTLDWVDRYIAEDSKGPQ